MQGKPRVYCYCYSKMNNQWNVTEGQLLPRVRGEGEAEQCHARDEDTRDDQVEEVVESSPPDVDREGDVHVWLWAAVVRDTVLLAGDSYKWDNERILCSGRQSQERTGQLKCHTNKLLESLARLVHFVFIFYWNSPEFRDEWINTYVWDPILRWW